VLTDTGSFSETMFIALDDFKGLDPLVTSAKRATLSFWISCLEWYAL